LSDLTSVVMFNVKTNVIWLVWMCLLFICNP